MLQATLAGVGDELVQFVMVFGLAATGAMALVDRVLLRSPLHGAGHRRVHHGPTRAGPSRPVVASGLSRRWPPGRR